MESVKIRVAVAALYVVLVCGAAFAQEYHIRVSQNTNLRASDSLESVVLASARAGTILEVVGRQERWLRVEHDGRQYWMARWVNHTRVGEPQATPEPVPAAAKVVVVDNCCFVNRQCATNQDWEAGYWAYQWNECPLSQPAIPGTTPVSPPAGQAVDNCCFVNRQCATEQEWVDGYHAFQYDSSCQNRPPAAQSGAQASGRFTCQAPSHSHPVGIFGHSEFKNKLGCALDLLKRKGGRWYGYVVSALKSIQPKGGTLITVYSHSREVFWGTDGWSYRSSDYVSLGAIMAHEACHVYYKESSSQVEEEIACTRVELQALDALGKSPGRRSTLVKRIENLRDNPDLRWWGRH